ncbi:hypothetical protein MXB_1786 [Myxobolus squamalis]|nr:hypothetical protein MXB_1786 [Myxobolus squamalis]
MTSTKEESTLPRLVAPVKKFRKFLTCEMCTKNCQIIQHNFSKSKDSDVYKSLKKDVSLGDMLRLPSRQYLGFKRVVLPVDPQDDSYVKQIIQDVYNKISKAKLSLKADEEPDINQLPARKED